MRETAYLSKTDFKVGRTCAAKLYYRKLGYPSTRDDDPYLQFLADGGYMVEAIAKLLYPEGIEIGFDKGPEESAAETMRLLQTNERITLFEATLLSSQKLARVDILRKQGNTFELIEVKAKLQNKNGHECAPFLHKSLNTPRSPKVLPWRGCGRRNGQRLLQRLHFAA
jgi:hypothetical protein